MGNQQPAFTPVQPLPHQPGGAFIFPAQVGVTRGITTVPTVVQPTLQQPDDCCSPNVPPSVQAACGCVPNYSPGIVNTPYLNQGNSACCDCCGGPPTVVNPGAAGYNLVGYPQQSVDPCCCGADTNVRLPPYTQQTFTQQQLITQVTPITTTPVRSSTVVVQPPIMTSAMMSDPVSGSVIETEVYQPSTIPPPEVNPFKNLPNRIVSIIQRVGVNNRKLQITQHYEGFSQYIPEKQAYYEGQWADGYMNGFGRLYFDSGAYFEGEFVNGYAQTQHGLFIYPDGSYYLGGVDRNTANGPGEFNYRGGRLIYKGQFLNDQPDGHGVQLYSDGSRYEGEFRFGKKQGQGQFVWKDGTVYTGQFENGFMQGEGVHRLSNGQIYEGEFRKNKRHGRGKHTAPLGTYIGGYRKDKKEGAGEFMWRDGKMFKGTFHDGKPDGPGSLTLQGGTTVYGIWINGVLDQTSLTTTNPNQGGNMNQSGFRGSTASIGSIGSINFGSGLVRTSQIVPGPPMPNLRGGMLAGGFVGMASPFVNQRGSIVSVIGPGGEFRGSIIPRGSNVIIPSASNVQTIRGSSLSPIIRGSTVSPVAVPLSLAPVLSSTIGRRPTPMPPMGPRVSTFGSTAPIFTPAVTRASIVGPSPPPRVSTITPLSPFSGVRAMTPIPSSFGVPQPFTLPIVPTIIPKVGTIPQTVITSAPQPLISPQSQITTVSTPGIFPSISPASNVAVTSPVSSMGPVTPIVRPLNVTPSLFPQPMIGNNIILR